jgi:RNA recognition motif-containing protein
MNMIKLYGKPIRVNKASAHQKNLDVGANIFIGNLDPEVDEKLLYDTFSAFGVILTTPKVIIVVVVSIDVSRYCCCNLPTHFQSNLVSI